MFNRIKEMIRSPKRKFNWILGFSLIELIVVVAILAVLATILAPSLLSYVERSRAQADIAAMDEIVNSVSMSVSYIEGYDELLVHSNESNVSCYIDTSTEAGHSKIVTKNADDTIGKQYAFGDKSRTALESEFYAAGNMYGVTITFVPQQNSNGKVVYSLKNAIINKYISAGEPVVKLTDCEFVYNYIRQTIGNDVVATSNTYKNSDYTVFIRIGSVASSVEMASDTIEVYGQYNGISLPYPSQRTLVTSDRVTNDTKPPQGESGGDVGGDTPGGSTEPVVPQCSIVGHQFGKWYRLDDIYHAKTCSVCGDKIAEIHSINKNGECNICLLRTIPIGATYTTANGVVLNPGADFPDTVANNDVYTYGDYKYTYQASANGWRVDINTAVTNKNKESYGEILNVISNKSVTNMANTFKGCASLEIAPEIPHSIINMAGAFMGCTNLTTAPKISSRLTNMANTFDGCSSLKTYVGAPSGTADGDFSGYVIPSGVTDMRSIFYGCTALTAAPTIPNSVKDISLAFFECASLAGSITVNSTPTSYDGCLQNTSIVEILGDCSDDIKAAIMKTK